MRFIHIPVFQKEIVGFIEDSTHEGRGILVDCTIGEGGHAELILNHFKAVTVIGFDRDSEILKIAKERLRVFGSRIDFINDNFDSLPQHLAQLGKGVSYILYDFGISSFHFEESGRGFSFGEDEFLDMRLDGEGVDAAHVVNTYDEKKLADIFHQFGEERWSRRIAAAICRIREDRAIETTGQLAEIVLRAIPRRFHVRNIHPATRVFQALRIAVNDELNAIEKALKESYRFLISGGRIMAISFHSLEDRIVKNSFRRLARGCTCDEAPGQCRCDGQALVRILTKKPLRPGEEEIEGNSRARSARLRVCERL